MSKQFTGLLPVATAWAEYQQDIGTRIGCVVPYEVDLARVMDLTDAGTTAALGFDVGEFMCPWKAVRANEGTPRTWLFVDRLIADGVHAIGVPSAANPGGV